MDLDDVPESPEEDFSLLLIQLGFGIAATGKKSWGCYFGFDPPGKGNSISLSSSNAIAPMRPINYVGPDVLTGLVEYPIIQVRVLAVEYQVGYRKSWQIASGVSSYTSFVGAFWKYLTFRQLTVPLYLQQDENGRHLFAFDIAATRTPFVADPSESPSPSASP